MAFADTFGSDRAKQRRADFMPEHRPNNKPSPGSLAAFNGKRPAYGQYGGSKPSTEWKGELASFGGTNLNKFISEVNKRQGLYKPNLYFVMIDKPPGIASDGIMETVMYMCNSAALPGAQILTSDYRRQGFGTFDRRPFGVQVTDIPLTFFVDNQGNLMNFFHEWMDNIVHFHGPHEHNVKDKGYQKFEVGYRKDYITTIQIYCFNHITDEIMKYTLYEAFPIQMGDITVAWAETDSFSILPVQFTFRTYDFEHMKTYEGEHGPGVNPNLTLGKVAGNNRAGEKARSMNIVGALSNIAGSIGLIKNAINTPLSVGSAINLVNNSKIVGTQLTNII